MGVEPNNEHADFMNAELTLCFTFADLPPKCSASVKGWTPSSRLLGYNCP
jgi:hypothetical protein